MIEIENLKEKINQEGFIVSSCKGKSMQPFLHENDKVLINKVNREIKKYDVVLYEDNGKNILHRVINIVDEYLYIRGDNSLKLEKVKKEDVIGILNGFYNNNGYIEINDELNYKYYKLSSKSLPLRKLKYYIGRIIK